MGITQRLRAAKDRVTRRAGRKRPTREERAQRKARSDAQRREYTRGTGNPPDGMGGGPV